MRHVFRFFVLLSALGALAGEKQAPRVMTWVPPYGIEQSLARLNESYNGFGPKDGVTHLALQFWTPSKRGEIRRVKTFGTITDAHIARFQKWGRQNGVQIMLCVYNGAAGWDWSLAQSAFETHRRQFINSLVSETKRLQLDGVDIDLEGKGHDRSKGAFLQFIRELSTALQQSQKLITVDTFAYKWNAPNQRWWSELLPLIDGLNVMGYAETGATAEGWRAYSALKAAAGAHASKILIGMPGHAGKWQGDSLAANLQWVVDDQSVGLAIWDARFKHADWRTHAVWQTIARIRSTH
jgi:GH18 family chitinase